MSNSSSQLQSIEEIIQSRRTINSFSSIRPPDAVIVRGLELACWAPNHKLTEPWRYYLLGPETAQQIVELNAVMVEQTKGPAAAQKKRDKWSAIPGWLVVTYQRAEDELRDRENYAAVCCAVQNLSLYLWSEGIGMKWTTGGVTRSDEIYEILDLNRDREEIVGVFWYGAPAEIPHAKRHSVVDFIQQKP